ncbi:hypothetical protein BV25DRAFT_1921527 [Artomyces pyxidatus]|uniref:Uncharacterized protein n=1 Tax=Artomyces pyxidatus TaxID=48021 RepID=A0ACB8SIU3_9AGAM|nr:hypothetical protein BV25DRAFT_1921527 [Artomyces pyxidatus]
MADIHRETRENPPSQSTNVSPFCTLVRPARDLHHPIASVPEYQVHTYSGTKRLRGPSDVSCDRLPCVCKKPFVALGLQTSQRSQYLDLIRVALIARAADEKTEAKKTSGDSNCARLIEDSGQRKYAVQMMESVAAVVQTCASRRPPSLKRSILAGRTGPPGPSGTQLQRSALILDFHLPSVASKPALLVPLKAETIDEKAMRPRRPLRRSLKIDRCDNVRETEVYPSHLSSAESDLLSPANCSYVWEQAQFEGGWKDGRTDDGLRVARKLVSQKRDPETARCARRTLDP